MLRKKSFWIGIGGIIIISIAFIVTGFIVMNADDGLEKGCYFRKTYGYVGSVQSASKILYFDIFVVKGEDYKFLKSENSEIKIAGSDNIVVESAKIESVKKTNNIETISYKIVTKTLGNTKIVANEIYFYDKDKLDIDFFKFDIGNIIFQNIDADDQTLSKGINSNFLDKNEYVLTLSQSNKFDFTVKQFLLESILIDNLKHNLPVEYLNGVETKIKITFENKVKENDIFLCFPIIVFFKNAEPQNLLYSGVEIATIYNKGMTYDDIKDYVLDLQEKEDV